jgi:hypothetical protein
MPLVAVEGGRLSYDYTADWETIKRALLIITDLKRGLKEELLKRFVELTGSELRAQKLFEQLELLGYLSNGISKQQGFKETWRATKKAYKEIYPTWKLIGLSLLRKL